MKFWRASPEWSGEIGYILAGGPSATEMNIDNLRGKHLVVINKSFETAPWADFLIFTDERFWIEYSNIIINEFHGRVICAWPAMRGNNFLRMKQSLILSRETDTVMVQFTTVTAAINLEVHLGVKKIVLLGVDGGAAADGRTHHHKPYPWKMKSNWFQQKQDLISIAKSLKDLGVECVNANPKSAWLDIWKHESIQ